MQPLIFQQGSDNWGYILYNKKGGALAIDPLESNLYLQYLETKKLTLEAILCTHYHSDHIQGIPDLIQKNKVPVFGPKDTAAPAFIDHQIYDGKINLDGFNIEATFLPGHSKSHIVYRETKKNFLFVGDLLFHLGCGRVVDGSPELLYDSLQELKEFPMASELFVGHDYRQKNHSFCTTLNPKFYSALNLSDLDKSTTLEMELWWNPFLKAESFDEWWQLRELRNKF